MPGEICNWETYIKWSNTTRTFANLSDWQFSDFISSEIPDSCLAAAAYSEPSPMSTVLNLESPYSADSDTIPVVAAIDIDTPLLIDSSPISTVSVTSVQSKSISFSGKTKTLSATRTNNRVLVGSNNYKVEN
jgi:hypothetical protein